MNADVADSSSGSNFPELAPILEETGRRLEPLPSEREWLVLKALSRARPIELTPDELETLESAGLIKRMPLAIENSLRDLPAMVSEFLRLGGRTPENLKLVQPLIRAFQPKLDVQLPRSAQRHGMLGLARQRTTSQNWPLHSLIEKAKSDRHTNQLRFVELCLELKQASDTLLRYRRNHQSYVHVGSARVRITEQGVARLRLLKLDEFLFGD